MNFQKKLCLTVSSFIFTAVAFAAHTQNLFQITVNGTNLTVTPTLNKYYPSMGINIPNGTTPPTNCTMGSNGYCLFASSKSNPKVLQFTNSNNPLLSQGTICLLGSCGLNCQTYQTSSSIGCQGLNGVCRAFLSLQTNNGDFSGIDPDAICTAEATNAGLGGTYIAWLSLNDQSAAVRFDTAGTASRSSTVNTCPASAQVFGPSVQFWLDTQAGAITCLANGTIPANLAPWTGLDPDGSSSNGGAGNCANFTDSTAPDAGLLGSAATSTNNILGLWTSNDSDTCDHTHSWYCIEVP